MRFGSAAKRPGGCGNASPRYRCRGIHRAAPSSRRFRARTSNHGLDARRFLEQVVQFLLAHLVDFAVPPADTAYNGGVAGQMRDVAGELAGIVDDDGFGRVAGLIENFNLAAFDDEEAVIAIAGFEQRFSFAQLPHFRF